MGRIPKSKIEQIEALLQKGYLKKEVAKEVGVHVRTVSKYDPNRKPKSEKGYSMKGRQENMSELLRTLFDWLYIQQHLDPMHADSIECPRCQLSSLRWTELDSDVFYHCVNCGYRLIWPWEICRRCFSQCFSYDSETRQYICPECGNRWNG